MKNKETGKRAEVKIGYGCYFMIIVFLNFIIFPIFFRNITPHSLSYFSALAITVLQSFLDIGTLYFLLFWVMDLFRKRGEIERPPNKKIRSSINIGFIILFILIIMSIIKN